MEIPCEVKPLGEGPLPDVTVRGLPPHSEVWRRLLATNPDETPVQPFWDIPQRSDAWFEARLHRMTGSVVPKALGMFCKSWSRRYEPKYAERFKEELEQERDKVFRVMSGLVDGDHYMPAEGSFGRTRIDYGVRHENEAVSMVRWHRYVQEKKYPYMAEVGLLIHPDHPWMGCSVDGLFEDSFVEAKCGMGYVYKDWKPYHEMQIRWNQDVCSAIFPGICRSAWFVGWSERGSCIRHIMPDRMKERELYEQMRDVMDHYCNVWLPAHGVTPPPWLQSAFK